MPYIPHNLFFCIYPIVLVHCNNSFIYTPQGRRQGGGWGGCSPPPTKESERREERGEREREEREKRNQKRKEVEPDIPRTCGQNPLAAPRPLSVITSACRASRQPAFLKILPTSLPRDLYWALTLSNLIYLIIISCIYTPQLPWLQLHVQKLHRFFSGKYATVHVVNIWQTVWYKFPRLSRGRMPACYAEGMGSSPGFGAQEISILSFISRNSATCRSHAA